MFATLASPEELRPFVSNFDRDIVKMTGYPKYKDAAPEIAKRLATGKNEIKFWWESMKINNFNDYSSIVGARISYPECKDVSASANATEAKYILNGYLNTRTVQYFRLGPEHFYSSDVLYLRVRVEF